MIISRQYALKLIREGKAVERFTSDGGILFVHLGNRQYWTQPLQYVVIDRLDIWRTDHYIAVTEDFKRSAKWKDDHTKKEWP